MARTTKDPLYRRWATIKSRCFKPRATSYHNYGGRGIGMHGEWVSSFPAFRDWVLQHLGAPLAGFTLDRIDNDGHYEPGNLRWATYKEQLRNKRTNRRLTLNGKTEVLERWAELVGARSPSSIRYRLDHGWPIERALSEPPRRNNDRYEHDGQLFTRKELALLTGLPYPVIKWRLQRGWSVSRIVETPSRFA